MTCFYFSTCTCFCTYYSLKVITSFLIICWSFVKWWTRKVQKFKKSSQLWIFFGPLAIWLRFQLWKLMKIYKTWTARAHTFSISMLSWFDVFVVWWIKIESNLKHSNELNPRNYIFPYQFEMIRINSLNINISIQLITKIWLNWTEEKLFP